MSGYEISSNVDKGSTVCSLLIKKQILVQYFFLNIWYLYTRFSQKSTGRSAEILEVGAFYINFERELVGLLWHCKKVLL